MMAPGGGLTSTTGRRVCHSSLPPLAPLCPSLPFTRTLSRASQHLTWSSSSQTHFGSPAQTTFCPCSRLPSGSSRLTSNPNSGLRGSGGPGLHLTSSLHSRVLYPGPNRPHYFSLKVLLPRFFLPCSPKAHSPQKDPFSTGVDTVAVRY